MPKGRLVLPQQLLELRRGESGLAKNGSESSSLDRRVLRNYGDAAVRVLVDGMAALRANVDESRFDEGVDHFAEGKICEGRAHAAEAI